jgi:hypothetical protein
MTKEVYKQNENNLSFLLYQYYIEKFDNGKHKPLLNQEQLLSFLPIWGSVGDIMKMVVNYYKEKFKE